MTDKELQDWEQENREADQDIRNIGNFIIILLIFYNNLFALIKINKLL